MGRERKLVRDSRAKAIRAEGQENKTRSVTPGGKSRALRARDVGPFLL